MDRTAAAVQHMYGLATLSDSYRLLIQAGLRQLGSLKRELTA
jgi:hypothetical protein